MKINVHTHVFNFQSILTRETVMLMKHRLSGKNLPEPLREAVLAYFEARLESRQKEMSIKDFQQTIREFNVFSRLVPKGVRSFFDKHLELPGPAETNSMMMSLLESAVIDRNGLQSSSVVNAFEWLRIGLMESIDAVTDDLMTHMDADDVAVVLPMDIISQRSNKQELQLFIRQMEDTSEQALRYPGRVLPFFMVNPNRKDTLELFKESAESGACVGLKLYPSLGYAVYEGIMKEVLQYCNDHELPVLLHCNDAGFRMSKKDADHSNPKHWIPVLEELEGLKVCFGHFGGDIQDKQETWSQVEFSRDTWSGTILSLMEQFPGRVFGDVSFHATHRSSEEAGQNYRKHLLSIMEDERYQGQVLWGTDYHLLRMDCSDTVFTDGFQEILGGEYFGLISKDNPVRFLGLPVNGAAEGKNITRHVEWLHQRNARAVHGKPAAWLQEHPLGREIRGGHVISGDGAAWDLNNRIHTTVFNFIWNYDKPDYLSEGMRKYIKDRADTPQAMFEMLGRTAIGELTFHNDVLGSATDMNHTIRSFANRLNIWFSGVSDFERYNRDEEEFYRKIISVCSRPANTIPDIAEVASLFYRMKPELMTQT